MYTQSPDTNVKSEQMLISLLREKSVAKKFALIRSLSQSIIQLSKRALARANEGIDDDHLNVLFVNLHYGKQLANQFKNRIEKKYENA